MAIVVVSLREQNGRRREETLTGGFAFTELSTLADDAFWI
jgi:hypothetical protein